MLKAPEIHGPERRRAPKVLFHIGRQFRGGARCEAVLGGKCREVKASLKTIAKGMKAEAAPPPPAKPEAEKSYAVAATRSATRQVSGHYAAADVHAFRVLAAEMDMDVQELLAEALNMVFERHGRPNRIAVTRGRRKRAS